MDYTKSRKSGKIGCSGFYNPEVPDFQKNHSREISAKRQWSSLFGAVKRKTKNKAKQPGPSFPVFEFWAEPV